MTTEQFIEKAIEGGREVHPTLTSGWLLEGHQCPPGVAAIILLDAEAWKAVGKIEGWPANHLQDRNAVNWLDRMHGLIDHLAEGGTIESYLETL